MKWIGIAVLLVVTGARAYEPVPVQKSQTEIDLQAALNTAETDSAKTAIAMDFLDSTPMDIPAARLAQNALFRTLDNPVEFFKARAEKGQSMVDHYLYGRASEDSTIMAEQAEWILRNDPKNPWGHMLAGIAEWERAKPDNAFIEKHFQEAIAADPSRPESYLNLGYLYEDMDEWTKAREAFEAGAIADPEYNPIRDARITVYATLREADPYFKLLEPMLPKEPLTGELPRANAGATGSVNMADALKGQTSVIEYWAYT